jgi:hypothetical protein
MAFFGHFLALPFPFLNAVVANFPKSKFPNICAPPPQPLQAQNHIARQCDMQNAGVNS